MSNLTGTVRAKVRTPENPTIYNVVAVVADTEYAQVLSGATKQLRIKARGNAKLRIAFSAGATATSYVTVPRGCEYPIEAVNYAGNIYFRSNVAGETVEIVEWV